MMIDGVRVLNTIPEQGMIIQLILVGAIFIIISLLCFYVMFITEDSDLAAIPILALIIGCVSLFIGIFNKQPEQYQVIVEDTVSMTEFNEHYKIIEQNGEIYTVEVKE